MFPPGSRESFERSLHDSLAADVNPRARGHLAVHRQAKSLEAIEFGVVRPLADKVRIRDQNARRFIVGPKNANRFAGLHEKRFIVLEFAQRANNRVETLPSFARRGRSRRRRSVVRILGDLRIEIVHQHPQRGFLMPAFAAEFTAARRADDSFSTHELLRS